MFSIFKHSNNPIVPAWASFFKENEYSEFLNAIDGYFVKQNMKYTIGDGIIEVEANDSGFDKLGLANLAQNCKLNGVKRYKNLVSEHFDCMARANKYQSEFELMVNDFDKIKEFIGVRLYPKEYVSTLGRELTIGKDFAGDIYAMLVFDLPDSVINVQPKQADKWGKSKSALFELGLQNIKNKYPLDISQQQFDDFALWYVHGNHFFTPNIVFDLANRKELIGSKGALIGIPHRHSVLIFPIENINVAKAINRLIPAIYGMNQEGPGSVSNNLFWYKDGEFENLPYKIEADKIQFYPTDNFAELLSGLN